MDTIHDLPEKEMPRSDTPTTAPTAALAPIKLYRCAQGHEVLTRSPFEVFLTQESEQGRMVFKTEPLCVVCFGSKLNKLSAMVEVETAETQIVEGTAP